MTFAVSHNGGRSQTNPNLIFNGGEYPFLNMMKTADPNWSPIGALNGGATNTPITPDMLDSDGYPTTLVNTRGINFGPTGGIYNQLFVAALTSRSGNYVITWDGNGTIYAQPGAGSFTTRNGTSKTSSTGSGRYEFTTTTSNDFRIGIAVIGSPRITNIKVFHEDDEEALTAGEVFGAKFKEKLIESGCGLLRFLNWMGGVGGSGANGCNTTSWYSRKPLSYVWYSGHEMRPDIYCGRTSNVSNDYTASAPAVCSANGLAWDGVLRDKTTVQVLFNASATQSGTCSLNVGGTGAKNMLGSNSGPLSDAVTRYPIGDTWQSLATLVYDIALDAWIKRGGDTAGTTQGLNTGVPPDLMTQLCAEVGAHISIPVPFFTCTPATDWLPKFLELYLSSAPSWMRIEVEGPNETWNPSAAGLANFYASAVSAAYGWGSDYSNWYGKALSHIGQITSFMFGADRTKYTLTCGVQTSRATSAGGMANLDPQLSSAKYVANTGGLQTSQTLTGSWGTINISASVGVAEAWRWATCVAVTNYFNSAYSATTTGTINETDLAAAYAGGDLTAPQTYIDGLNPPYSIVTFTNGTPGQINWTAHGLSVDQPLFFIYVSGGNLSGTPSSGAVRYVKTVIDPDHFTISTAVGGAATNLTVTGSGTTYAIAGAGFAELPSIALLHENWKIWAQSFGIQRMRCYEGGYSPPNYTNGGASTKDLLFAAGKLVTSTPNNPLGLLGYTQDQYHTFIAMTDGTFTAEFPSCFNFGGKTPSANSWSVMEDVYLSPNPPQFEAFRLFNARLRRVSLTATT